MPNETLQLNRRPRLAPNPASVSGAGPDGQCRPNRLIDKLARGSGPDPHPRPAPGLGGKLG